MSPADSWAAYGRQMLPLRTPEVLASTDPLTGTPEPATVLERGPLAEATGSAS